MYIAGIIETNVMFKELHKFVVCFLTTATYKTTKTISLNTFGRISLKYEYVPTVRLIGKTYLFRWLGSTFTLFWSQTGLFVCILVLERF